MRFKRLGAAVLAAAVMAATAVSAVALDVTADRVVVDEYNNTYYYWEYLEFYGDSETTLDVSLDYELTSFDDITEIVIPETVDGKNVTFLWLGSFTGCKNLKSITIPISIEDVWVQIQSGEGEDLWSPFESLTDVYYEGTREQYEKISCSLPPYYGGTFDEGDWFPGYGELGNEWIPESWFLGFIEKYGNVTPSEFLFGDATIHFSDGTTAKPSEIGIPAENPDDSKTETEDFTSNGVTATADEGVIPEGAEFSAALKSVTDEDFTYNLKFTKDGEEVQPEGTVTVKLPIPEAFLGINPLYVYRIEADGTRTLLKSKIEDGYIIFETDHFSEYLFTTEELDEDNSGDVESSDDENNSDNENSSDNESNKDESDGGDGKGDKNEVPDTGFAGVAMTLGVVALAGAAVVVSRKRK